ncbi:right-handed parallel beta-helix repeat-containing protein [Bacillus sp. SD088]|uniref:right-handed parallel beta-helix repeat-containing protein n=1 Tax=Bacillus sp. SD088 TaxID=2782012 RepID=UPI001A9596F0|nr:right-handed parallel beta-helix repeat-containing protein [Bacillus sp. SD088]MBO0992147.1 right-handed parallel beta-helix repeat-containing protein [Bacillus sp. SD088]
MKIDSSPDNKDKNKFNPNMTRRRFVGSLGLMAGLMTVPGILPNVLNVYAQDNKEEKEDNSVSQPKSSGGGDWYNVKDFNVSGNGTEDDAPALKQLVDTLGDKQATIYFPAGTYLIGKNLLFPRNLLLLFDNGAVLKADKGTVVEIQSLIEAKATQIFAGSGKVIGNFSGAAVYPQWWGAKGDKQNDDTEAFQKVFRLSNEIKQSITIYVTKGDYVWSEALEIYGNTSVICEEGAIFWRNHTVTMLRNYEYNGTPHEGYTGNGNILFENAQFELVGFNPSVLCYEDGNVLQFAHAADWTFRNCKFYDLIDAHAIEINSSKNVVIEDCKFYGYRELAENRWYVEAIQIDHAGTGGIQGALPYDDTHCKNVIIKNCYFGKGNSYTFQKSGIETTVEFKAWPAGIGGHTHKEGKWHQNISIRNNTFEEMCYYAIRPYKWLNVTITENTFYECGGGIYAVSGAKHQTFGEAGPFRRMHITKNQFINGKEIYPEYFQGNRRFAIGIYSTDVVSEDVQIEGNTLSVSKDNGIIISNVKRVSIINNTINYMDKSAVELIDCSNIAITNNQIFKPNEYGIFLKNCTQYVISKNHLEETQEEGLQLEDSSLGDIDHNIVTKALKAGIYCKGLTTIALMNNIINHSEEGIDVSNCEIVDIKDNRVIDIKNQFVQIHNSSILLVSTNTLVTQTDIASDALTFEQATHTGIIRDNIIHGKFRYGIWFDEKTSNLKYGYNLGSIQNDSDEVEALQD